MLGCLKVLLDCVFAYLNINCGQSMLVPLSE